jgi:hypothetical protein
MADHEKIKTCFAQIIVNNSEDKPYYSIMYWENGEMNIGFSSYKLDYVRRWLNEEFEVKRNVDVVPVVRCKDCKYAYINRFSVASGVVFCSSSMKAMQEDDFCSDGERRDGGADND